MAEPLSRPAGSGGPDDPEDVLRLLGDRLAVHVVRGGRELVAFVGGGGKTTLLVALGRALLARGRSVLLTTTTKVGAGQVHQPGLPFAYARIEGTKAIGLSPAEVDARFASGDGDVLVEADGSRHKVVKAPAPYEPVIPSAATVVVAVLGADGIDRVIEDVAHRPMRVAAAAGCGPYERLTPARASRLLTSERGARKSVPEGARFVVALTRVGPAQEAAASEVARLVRAEGVDVAVLPFVEAEVGSPSHFGPLR